MAQSALEDRPEALVAPVSVGAGGEALPAAAPKAGKARIVFPLLLAIATVGGVATYLHGLGKESTDDAQVEAHVASVAPRVAGQVKRVLVKDNQEVKAGDVLVELDDRDIAARLAAARADLAAAKAQVRAAEAQVALTRKSIDGNLVAAKGSMAQAAAIQGSTTAGIDQAKADIVAAQARRDLAATDFSRTERLVNDGALTTAALDTSRANRDAADATLLQAEARLASAKAAIANVSGTYSLAKSRMITAESGPEQLEAAEAQAELTRAREKQSEAALAQAELALSYTKVVAEVAGTVARRTVEAGQLVSPDRPLLAIVPLNDTWIVANFKEDQLAHMHAGQPVDIRIDTFDSVKLTGVVDSLSAGTGARFSLLPPDNASGNFTKVVQRVPVLIRFAPHEGTVLRPGMSADVTVHTK